MKPNVLITKPIPAEVESFIAEHCRYTMWNESGPMPLEQYYRLLAEADGLLTTTSDRITKEKLDHAPRLKVISNIGVGYNNFDLDEMKKRGIIGTNTPGVLDETVADLIFGLMLAAARRIAELDAYVRAGRWSEADGANLFGIDVHHRTLGIIGMGRIGEAVARRAKWGFGMNVLYHNRNRKPEAEAELGAQFRPMDRLLAESDFIVLMTPLTPDTHRLIGENEFKLMKKTAVFVNASRGETVDEQALYEALRDRRIYAAGLDVFEREPLSGSHPLASLPNAVLLPHIGSATGRTRADMAMLAAENLVAALEGRRPPNIVTS